MIYQKNDKLEVEITDLGSNGEGIGKVDGYTLFVKDGVIGDRCQVTIMKAKKHYAYAHLDRILTPSKDRVKAPCLVARSCGGCQIQEMSYEAQLSFKENKVRNNLIRLGKFSPEEIDRILQKVHGMDQPFHYRNKAQYPFGLDRSGRILYGFYAGRTHSIIEAPDCLIGVQENHQILELIRRHMESHRIPPYVEKTKRGILRHVLIRKGFATGQLMVCLVLRKRMGKGKAYLPGQEELIHSLTEIPGMTSISVNFNPDETNVIMGRETHTIWGSDTIEDTLCGLTFRISPLSFYQVNPVQTEYLYGKAIEYADLHGEENVYDLYCGIGTITLAMAGKAGHVYGVEVIPDAIRDARENARRNGISNAEFTVGKAEDILPSFYKEKEGALSEDAGHEDPKSSAPSHPDVIVVDPPRKGCAPETLETMLKMRPDRIVYVSCDSATLARDLRILADGGYQLQKAQPVDLFPHTTHVETIVLMTRVE